MAQTPRRRTHRPLRGTSWTPGDPPRFTPVDSRNYHEGPELRRVDQAILHPKRITHAVLNVGDVEACLAFYTGILGLQVLRGSPADSYVVLGGTTGGEHIILIPTPDSKATGLHHAGFEMWSKADLDQSNLNLQSVGLAVEQEITTDARRSLFIRDPDGFLLEFYTELEPNTPCPATTPN